MRTDINEIALYSQGVYPIQDLYAMSNEMVSEIKQAMIAKAEKEREAYQSKNTKRF